MKQITVKTVVEALHWIHNNHHYSAGVEWPKTTPNRWRRETNWTHFWFKGGEKVRIPRHLYEEVATNIRMSCRRFDNRMYMLTRVGRKMIGAETCSCEPCDGGDQVKMTGGSFLFEQCIDHARGHSNVSA
jgi:hypothetical protein